MGTRLSLTTVALISTLCLVIGIVVGSLWTGPTSDPGACEARVSEALAAQAAELEAAKAEEESHQASTLEAAAHRCNVCGSTRGFKRVKERPHAECLDCGSRERHRLLMHYLEHETPLFSGQELRVLHFSANRGLRRRLRAQKSLDYKTSLFASDKADLELDITDIDQPDQSWDFVIAYHILEHIVDDRRAMRELFRILRPGGAVILQVPLWADRTEVYEDPSIVDPKARKEAFGQNNHVRKYSAGALRGRLEMAGFEVEAVDYLGGLDPAMVERHQMAGRFDEPRDEGIWIARRPVDATER